jgi:hypothetical protein
MQRMPCELAIVDVKSIQDNQFHPENWVFATEFSGWIADPSERDSSFPAAPN